MTTIDLAGLTRAAAALEPGQSLDLTVVGLDTRDAYLGFVGAWKGAWHELVAEIRTAKCRRKRSAADFDPAAQWRREALRARARDILRLRLAAKAGARAIVTRRIAA